MAQDEKTYLKNDTDSITLCRTKNGKGFKLVHNGVWFYVANKHILGLLRGERGSAVFNRWQVRAGAPAPIAAREPTPDEIEQAALLMVAV